MVAVILLMDPPEFKDAAARAAREQFQQVDCLATTSLDSAAVAAVAEPQLQQTEQALALRHTVVAEDRIIRAASTTQARVLLIPAAVAAAELAAIPAAQ